MPTIAQATSKSAASLGYKRVSTSAPSLPAGAPIGRGSSPLIRTATPSTGVSADTLGIFQQTSKGRSQRLTAVPQLSDQ